MAELNTSGAMIKAMLAAVVLVALLASPSKASQSKPTEALKSMLKAQVFGPDWLLKQGFNGELETRNWKRLAAKLSTPGAKVQIVAFGGSVTAGHLEMARNCSWVDQLEVWLQSAFPAVKFDVLNLARGATDVTAASTCWYNFVPPTADLVLIEYSANGEPTAECVCLLCPFPHSVCGEE